MENACLVLRLFLQDEFTVIHLYNFNSTLTEKMRYSFIEIYKILYDTIGFYRFQ